ncbi:MAG: bifunctional folylpolyglutamate synthase/dihydrofolate synthase [Spirochaetales bacterium]|jgi:dihydrofolate synthase / folylpolyglutamate synthase|nr:bifunctional folylpolyglutamate synthase/dihydrofolate synthase [Spirochaetales bacterium]
MSFKAAFSYIESFTNLEKNLGPSMRPYRLDRMAKLLELFDHPERKFKSIHVSGSKGKGSTAIYIASALTEAGFLTGLYTSPHVISYRERITLAGKFIDDKMLIQGINRIRKEIENLDPLMLPGQARPTTFELLTLLAYLTFAELGCQWALIETGIGGRLDATNVLMPVATVHTPVELEHTEVLGETLEEIAAEKAGIIKPEIPVYCGYQREPAEKVFRKTAAKLNSPFHLVSNEITDIVYIDQSNKSKIEVSTKAGDRIQLKPGMAGKFQAENAALALIASNGVLESLGIEKADRIGAIQRGIERSKLPGRMELLRNSPPLLIDAAHTPSSVEKLAETYTETFGKKGILIFGSVLGKNPEAMARVLAPFFEAIIISTPGTFKPSDPQEVFEAFARCHDNVELHLSPQAALSRADELAKDIKPILVTGSFYMISEIKLLVDRENRIKVEA